MSILKDALGHPVFRGCFREEVPSDDVNSRYRAAATRIPQYNCPRNLFGSKQKRPGAKGPPEFVPESPLKKRGL